VYEEWDRTPDEDYDLRGYDRYQAVVKERRAGLLTHRWFLMSNTMFTSIPRTTAAQAYRAYLGYDIARLEGLCSPSRASPWTTTTRASAEPACAVCHATLDPLAYAFSQVRGHRRTTTRTTLQLPPTEFVDTEGPTSPWPPRPACCWASPWPTSSSGPRSPPRATRSARATVLDYWRLLVGQAPGDHEQAEFGALVHDLGDVHDYRVERMLHDLIDTEAYGAP
jgi:hypothetical protein